MKFEDVIWFVVFFFPKYAHVLELPFVLQLTMLVQWCTLQIFLYSKNIGCLKAICVLGCDEPSSFVDSFNILITFVFMITLPRFKLIVRHPYNEAWRSFLIILTLFMIYVYWSSPCVAIGRTILVRVRFPHRVHYSAFDRKTYISCTYI
jgi:hypothetical protein